ncbi:hypothetical protein CCMA1212_007893 [Trichoderma ghanense]|uniref:Uncharacterized protein n=1 Tax=Trichoderma ghanense TaxID=65468 RepID=A0ABY2GWF2_9HYPO
MDTPSGSNNSPNDGAPKPPDPNTMSRADYIRTARAAMEERRQRAVHNRQQFHDQIHEQIHRLFKDYEAPLHARLRGFGRAQTLALAETTVLSLAAVNNRPFADSETQALTEHFLSSVHNLLAWKWAMTGFAAYLTYRGRKTWRFPFFTPEFTRFSPINGSPGLKFMWHSARFAAYYTTIWVLGEPLFQGANFMRQRAAMEQDPRLRSLLHDGKAQGATLFGGNQEHREQINDAWESEAQHEGASQYREPEQQSQSAPGQSSWASYRNPTASSSQTSQPSDPWDAPVADDFDDASPIAPSARSTSDSSSGSAWDRIRQQAQFQPPSQQGRQTWEKPQSGGGWGSEADSSVPVGSRDSSYSFSRADEEKNLAKEQAQREFDRLLERERAGAESERRPWGGR